jgi:putative FmdB family regulatory protein
MPLYEYECQQCHRHTEKRQKFSDPEITVCPHCGGHLQRVISAPAIAFKGGGWYADGYGNAKPKSAGEGKSSGEGKTEASSSDASAKQGSGDTSGASTPTPVAAPSPPAPSSAPASTPTKS